MSSLTDCWFHKAVRWFSHTRRGVLLSDYATWEINIIGGPLTSDCMFSGRLIWFDGLLYWLQMTSIVLPTAACRPALSLCSLTHLGNSIYVGERLTNGRTKRRRLSWPTISGAMPEALLRHVWGLSPALSGGLSTLLFTTKRGLYE